MMLIIRIRWSLLLLLSSDYMLINPNCCLAQPKLSDFRNSVTTLKDTFSNFSVEMNVSVTLQSKELLQRPGMKSVRNSTFCISIFDDRAFASSQRLNDQSSSVIESSQQFYLNNDLGYSAKFLDRKLVDNQIFAATGPEWKSIVLRQISDAPYDGFWNEWEQIPYEPSEYIQRNVEMISISEIKDKQYEISINDKFGMSKFVIELDNQQYRLVSMSFAKDSKSIFRRNDDKLVGDLTSRFGSCKDTPRTGVRDEYLFYYTPSVIYPHRIKRTHTFLSADANCVDTTIFDYTVKKYRKISTLAEFDSCDCKKSQLLIPNGTRAIPSVDSIRNLELEWRDGKIVKTIDKQAVDVSAEVQMEKLKSSDPSTLWYILLCITSLAIMVVLLLVFRKRKRIV